MSTIVERGVNVALAVAALAVAGSVVARTFGSGPDGPSAGVAAPEYHEGWTTALEFGHVVHGSSNAPVTLLELTDLECPSCRTFQATIDFLVSEYSDELRVVYVPYPLDRHRFAWGAARAAECMAAEGRISEWIATVYAHQDSLGLLSWGELARRSGATDTLAIAGCANGTGEVQAIERGRSLGREVALSGTPTVILNGWKLPGVPTREELKLAMEILRAGGSLDSLLTTAQAVVRSAN